MQKVSIKHKSLIIGPPLLLVVIGIAIYITVVKIITPDAKVVTALPESQSSMSGTPQASPSANVTNPIEMNVSNFTSEEIGDIQAEADNGVDTWRFDVMETARHVAGKYGFTPGDQLTLTLESESERPSGVASVIAVHGVTNYILTLVQPGTKGDTGIWVLDKIEKR